MKFVQSREVEVPLEYLFDRASNFAAFEHRAAAHGVEVHRLTGGPVGPGCEWQIAGAFRGKPRQALIRLTDLTRPDHLALQAASGGFRLSGSIRFIALTKRRSKIEAEFEARATNLRSRIILHTLRLARGRIASRLKSALNAAAKRVEADFRA
jgi:hypothetical protein